MDKVIIIKVKVPIDKNRTLRQNKKHWETFLEVILNSWDYEWNLNLEMHRFINNMEINIKSKEISNKIKIEKFLNAYSEFRVKYDKAYKDFCSKSNYYEIQR